MSLLKPRNYRPAHTHQFALLTPPDLLAAINQSNQRLSRIFQARTDLTARDAPRVVTELHARRPSQIPAQMQLQQARASVKQREPNNTCFRPNASEYARFAPVFTHERQTLILVGIRFPRQGILSLAPADHTDNQFTLDQTITLQEIHFTPTGAHILLHAAPQAFNDNPKLVRLQPRLQSGDPEHLHYTFNPAPWKVAT